MMQLNYVRYNTLPKYYIITCFDCGKVISQNMMFGERNISISGCFVNVCEKCFNKYDVRVVE